MKDWCKACQWLQEIRGPPGPGQGQGVPQAAAPDLKLPEGKAEGVEVKAVEQPVKVKPKQEEEPKPPESQQERRGGLRRRGRSVVLGNRGSSNHQERQPRRPIE